MKVKRFDNIWTMGVILICIVLVVLAVAKIIFPEFVIEIAQIDSVVKFGEYVDSHKWAYYLFTGLTSFVLSIFYVGACIRKTKLNILDMFIIILNIIISFIVGEFAPQYLFLCNNISLILIPFLLVLTNKIKNDNVYNSTCISFILTSIFQVISLQIRGIVNLVTCGNSATYTILLIDFYILNILLYLFFNNRRIE